MTDPSNHTHGAHGHAHHHHHDYAGENEDYFSKRAEQYDADPRTQELARRVSNAMLKKYPSLFDENKTTLLDHACGPGLTSRQLCPHAKSIVGVDISQAMVDLFNLRVSNQGIPPEEMKAVRADLKGNDPELDNAKFDVIICVAAYHHFPSVDTTTRVLTSYLNPGGSLLVVDILSEEPGKDILGSHHGHIAHATGFAESDMRKTFEDAGLGEFEMTMAIDNVLLPGRGHGVKFFLARGVRPVQNEGTP